MDETSQKAKRLFRVIQWAAGILALLNLLMSVSLVALIGSIIIWFLLWGIHTGEYTLTRGLSIFLFFYAIVNLVVLIIVLASASVFSISAFLWLIFDSAAMIVLAFLLRGSRIQEYLKNAEPPKRKKHRIHFFHGGWRDL